MHLRACLTILICLILAASGCMRAAPPKPSPPPPLEPVKVGPEETYDEEIPSEYLALLRSLSLPAVESVPPVFLTMADRFAARGETETALHFLDKAASGFAAGGSQSGEATAWSRRTVLLSNMDRETEVGDLIREAREKWHKPPLKAFPGYIEGRLALLRGDFPRAISLLNGSLIDNPSYREDPYLLMLRRDAERDAGIAKILQERIPGLLTLYAPTGREISGTDTGGEGHLRKAFALNRDLRRTKIEPLLAAADFQRSEAETHNFLGLEMGMRGEEAEALRHLVRAGELSRTAGFPLGEIRSLLLLGEFGLRREEYAAEGRRATERLLEKADRRGASPYRVWSRLLLARYERKSGRSRDAIRLLGEAAGIIEAQRSGATAEMFAEIGKRQRRAVYEFLVELLSGERMAAEALKAAEAAKSIMTADLLAGQEMLGRTSVERDLLRREISLGDEIRGLQRRILQISDEAIAEPYWKRLKQADADYRDLLGRIRASDEGLFSLISVHGADPAVLQNLLDENTTLFAYFTTAEDLYVWAIHRNLVHLERIALPREELRSFVFSFLAAIRDKNRRRTDTLSRKAYNLLLKPIIPFVSGDRIGLILDDALIYLPFAAMSYRGKYLAEGFTIFHLPEAIRLGRVSGKTGTGDLRILAIGNPDLKNKAPVMPHAVQEIERIQKRIGAMDVLLHQRASETNVGEMAFGYDILHFAVRGRFFPQDILNSGLELTPDAGQDGRLTLREIFGLRFQGRAVVLSGCDPIPERDPEGCGLTILQKAFLHAGSRSVVSSLWLSRDRAGAQLSDALYRKLEKKEPLADLLRSAQLDLLREGYPPYVWAAFVLNGLH